MSGDGIKDGSNSDSNDDTIDGLTADFAARVSELESTDWVGQLREFKPKATGIDLFALGYAAGQQRNATQSAQSRVMETAVAAAVGSSTVGPVAQTTTTPSLIWLQTRAALCATVVSAALTWAILFRASTGTPGPSVAGPNTAQSNTAQSITAESITAESRRVGPSRRSTDDARNGPSLPITDADRLSTSPQPLGIPSPIEVLMSSPWRERALAMEQSIATSDVKEQIPGLFDTDLDSLRYANQRRQWLTQLPSLP